MLEIRGLDETYDQCTADGCFRIKEVVDVELAQSLLDSANQGLRRSQSKPLDFEKETNNFGFLLVERYDVSRKSYYHKTIIR